MVFELSLLCFDSYWTGLVNVMASSSQRRAGPTSSAVGFWQVDVCCKISEEKCAADQAVMCCQQQQLGQAVCEVMLCSLFQRNVTVLLPSLPKRGAYESLCLI